MSAVDGGAASEGAGAAGREPGREPGRRERLREEVAREVDRRREAEAGEGRSLLQSLGLVGAMGWMVALPAVGGVVLGRAFDRGSGRLTWTLALLFVGTVMGGYTAWRMLWKR